MSRRPPLPHAQIHLPPMSADLALAVVDVLDRVVEAIWRTHGERMGELRALRARRSPEPDDELVDDGDPNAPDDVDF